MNISKLSKYFQCLALSAVVFSGCVPSLQQGGPGGQSGSGFGLGQIGGGILGAAGVPHAEAIFNVGDKLSKASQKLTPEQEYFLGRGVSAMVFSKYPPVQNKSLTTYVNRVGNLLALHSDRPEMYNGYRFVVVDTPEINAMSAPGGYVYISRGFLKVMPNEDALAAVLAHEIGHIALNHGIDAISQSNLTDALLIVGKEAASSYGGTDTQILVSAFGDSINDVFSTLIDKGYSRSQEYEADEYSANLLIKAGYSPTGLTSTLNQLKTLEDSGSGGWFSTHPSAERRIDHLDKTVRNAPMETSATYNRRTARFRQAVKALG